jgi:hypothetical protein
MPNARPRCLKYPIFWSLWMLCFSQSLWIVSRTQSLHTPHFIFLSLWSFSRRYRKGGLLKCVLVLNLLLPTSITIRTYPFDVTWHRSAYVKRAQSRSPHTKVEHCNISGVSQTTGTYVLGRAHKVNFLSRVYKYRNMQYICSSDTKGERCWSVKLPNNSDHSSVVS